MNGFWGSSVYGDGSRVPLKSERCKSRPVGLPGTHVCRAHQTHEGPHRCICGAKWDHTGKAVK